MNIYDEALLEIKKVWNGNPLKYPKKTVDALECAKKVFELLELYRLEKDLKEQFQTNGNIFHRQKILDDIRNAAEEIQILEKIRNDNNRK